jgi:hypothetical protein
MSGRTLKKWIPPLIITSPPLIGLGAKLSAWVTHSPSQGVYGAIWPPLGSLEPFASFMAACFVGACFAYASKTKSKRLLFPLIVALIFLIGYAALVLRFVKGVETNQYGTVYRSIGYEKIEKVAKENPDLDDEELLEAGNLSDADIEKVWTPFSIWVVRLSLFVVYLIGLSALNVFWGMYESDSKVVAGHLPTVQP